ncbi:MAG TPA: hypothetical protein VE710_12025 [Candidatus Bathyarchaeia archaeon]|nr:hypothetical protein [Candidatus Bathyarchaeia archaeon]
MKILSVIGENVPAGKGGSPSDTFDRSIATYQVNGVTKTLTVTYVRYFERQLAEEGFYDQEKEGVPVNRIVSLLFLEKHPEGKTGRHYYNDFASFKNLFEGFSIEVFKHKYKEVTFVAQ